MFGIFNIGQKLFDKLRKRAYRRSYVAEHVRRGIAYQVRALRDQREWKQGKLAQELGKPQSVVSRLEDPSYGKVTVQTLLEVADVFDVALQVRFVPFSSFLLTTRDLTTASMQVPSFEDEIAMPLKIIPGTEVALTDQIPVVKMPVPTKEAVPLGRAPSTDIQSYLQ